MNSKLVRYALQVIKKDIIVEPGIICKRCFNAPYTITFSITDTCNARCATCTRWQNKDDRRELSFEEWKRLILKFSRWINPCYISFTGGEPFFKSWFYDLLEHANKMGVYSNVSTNGIVFDIESCDRIIYTGVDFILFSLNSIDPEIHNTYKGVDNLHQKIVSAIKYIKKENNKVRIGVSFIITKDNYATLSEFASWAYDLGVDSINFQVIRDIFGPNFSSHPSILASPNNLYWKIDNLKELDRQIDLLIKQKRKGLPIVAPINDLNIFKAYFRDPYKIPTKHRCLVGFRNFMISSQGDVRLCYMFPNIGNIRESDIKDIWFSKEAQKQRMDMLKCKIPCVSACLRDFNLYDQILNFLTRSGLLSRNNGNISYFLYE